MRNSFCFCLIDRLIEFRIRNVYHIPVKCAFYSESLNVSQKISNVLHTLRVCLLLYHCGWQKKQNLCVFPFLLKSFEAFSGFSFSLKMLIDGPKVPCSRITWNFEMKFQDNLSKHLWEIGCNELMQKHFEKIEVLKTSSVIKILLDLRISSSSVI